MIEATKEKRIEFYKKLIQLAKGFELFEGDDEISETLCKYNPPRSTSMLYRLSDLDTSEFYPLLLQRAKQAINNKAGDNDKFITVELCNLNVSDLGKTYSIYSYTDFEETNSLTSEELALEKALWEILMEKKKNFLFKRKGKKRSFWAKAKIISKIITFIFVIVAFLVPVFLEHLGG